MELLSKLGIDWRLLIAQIINFIVLLLILKRFLYRPVLEMLEKRQKKIEKSLEDVKSIEANLLKTEKDYKEEMARARREANEIVEKAGEQAEKNKAEMIIKAREEIGQAINEEKVKIQLEKAKVLKELKSEVADLVALSLKKVLEEKIDVKIDKELIKKIVK